MRVVQKRSSLFGNLVKSVNYDVLEWLFILRILCCQIAFTILKNDYFRELLTFMNAGLADLLSRAASTLRSWIMHEYAEHKKLVRHEIGLAQSDIHLFFMDGTKWDCHLVDLRTLDQSGRRTYQQASRPLRVVQQAYRIEHRIGYIVGDNINSNDTAAHTVFSRIYPELSAKDRTSRRIRRLAHIVNFCAIALILGHGKKSGDRELHRKAARGDCKGYREIWHGRGPSGRLHNIVQYVRWSPQTRHEFMACKADGDLAELDQFELLQDSVPRWNSFYTAIGRALAVRQRIDLFCRPHKPDKATLGLRRDILTAAHWQQLDKIHDCLNTFEVATLATQDSRPFFYRWFQTLARLFHDIGDRRLWLEEDATGDRMFKLLSECCAAAWILRTAIR